jgi:hypothetical protein
MSSIALPAGPARRFTLAICGRGALAMPTLGHGHRLADLGAD